MLHTLENVDIGVTGDALEKLKGVQFSYSITNIAGPGCKIDPNLICFDGCQCDSVRTCIPANCTCSHSNYTARKLNDIGNNEKIIYECNVNCKCSDTCQNRLVQHGVCIPLQIFNSEEKGLGLRAVEDIQRGEFVCEYAGEVICQDEAQARTNAYRDTSEMNYIISVSEYFAHSGEVVMTFVDPRRRGNVGRFINHACAPNLKMVPVRVDSSVPHLALFACRDISAGQELTFHYGGSPTEDTNWNSSRKSCRCGSTSCSGFLPFDASYIPKS